MAGSDTFNIKIRGVGGHGAEPKGTRDAIVASSQLILQFHTIISRDLSPLEEGVVTVGTWTSGERANIIAETADITGTIRWYDPKIETLIRTRMKDVIDGISKSYNVKIDLSWRKVPYPATVNHKICVPNVANAVKQVLGNDSVIDPGPSMVAEDFSFFFLCNFILKKP